MGIIQKTHDIHIQRAHEPDRAPARCDEEIPFVPAFDLLLKAGEVPPEHIAAIAVSMWRLLGGASRGTSRWSAEGAAKRF